ncbi:DNA-binding SARP family transcriptional activator [Kitasatospora sp. GP30]|uniref:AfsR/SARP family transcriptional regulator n=1 Tax=Kitasatospora sp. GP30 TaxID=3035084 RepID=UPI000C70D981|nr:BTAD domain-containing putative transcriptional regulator [Kitasatospora sp. GP30]MDH6143830.1 DNA-binding SARP family transcriptional activator [Kitasatospora sp. GP30]
MVIRLLGPVELRTADGETAELAGAQRRAVLALLALRSERVVPIERFFELLWGDEPPARARAALQGHVAALRKVLTGSPFELRTRAPGYLLTGATELIDVRRFEALAATAVEESDDAAAVALLEQALGLWSGAALADLPDTELRRALVDQLDAARTTVLTAWAERRLRLGSAAVAVPALEQSVRANGLREPVVALLMRALQQAGRLSDALAVYHHARERLAAELGVVPGAQLQAALAEVLGGGPAEGRVPAQRRRSNSEPDVPAPAGDGPSAAEEPVPVLPRQLPRQPAGFVGRCAESEWLDRECGPERTGDGLALVVGPAGAGKSATVIRWAHAVAGGFPDGQLFVDLRGFDPAGPVDPVEVLGRFLKALGMPEAAIAQDGAGRAAQYRAATEPRCLLVVLDNARSAEQVAELLPAGAGSAAVVTSRNTLEDLVVTEGAALLRLAALPGDDALRLLERSLAPERVRAEEAAARQLTALCDQLPLALRIAASRLAARPNWTIADLVTELSDERTRLLTLDTHGAVSIRTALWLTYRHLSLPAGQLLTLLAAHPGSEVDAYAGAALLGTDLPTARGALGELAAYHLLSESTPGRYSRHDLIRLFGMELFADQPEQVRRRSTERLLDYYQEAVRQCGDHVDPGQDAYGPRAHPPRAVPQPADARAALTWFIAEEPTIRALVAAAAEQDPERAWRLALQASGLYYAASRLIDWLSCLRSGLRAAERTGPQWAVSMLESTIANALIGVERVTEAVELSTIAVDRTSAADGFPHARAQATLALAEAVLGNTAEAGQLVDRALELARRGGRTEQLASALGYAGAVSAMAGDPTTGLARVREARTLLADQPAATIHAWALMTEAQSLQALGCHESSEQAWIRLLTTCREAGFLHLHAIAEQSYANFLLGLGREAEAAEHLRSAILLHRSHGHLAVAVTDLLAKVEQSLES